MNEESEKLILEAAARESPREACGLVWHDQAFVVPNIAVNGLDFFIMDRGVVQELYTRMMIPPTGVWHSHPTDGSEDPSESDLLYHPMGMRMYIVCDGKVIDHGIPEG